jgi:uncharacterized membrane protein HdeD (DUF308 family)
LAQQIPPPSKSSDRNRRVGIAALVIGLVIALVLGIFYIVLPSVKAKNQVQVWGKTNLQSGLVEYINQNGTSIKTAQITNGTYSLLVAGGRTYTAFVYYNGYIDWETNIYIPLGVRSYEEDLMVIK